MAFEEDRASGPSVDARLDHGKGRRTPEHVVAVMDHAMRMTIGLCFEDRIRFRLVLTSMCGLLRRAEILQGRAGAEQADEGKHHSLGERITPPASKCTSNDRL